MSQLPEQESSLPAASGPSAPACGNGGFEPASPGSAGFFQENGRASDAAKAEGGSVQPPSLPLSGAGQPSTAVSGSKTSADSETEKTPQPADNASQETSTPASAQRVPSPPFPPEAMDGETEPGEEATGGDETFLDGEGSCEAPRETPWPPENASPESDASSPVGEEKEDPSPDDWNDGSTSLWSPHPSEMGNGAVSPRTEEENKEDKGEEDNEEGSMSLMGHLGELRTRLVRALIGAAVGFLLCYGVAEELFHYLSLPLIRVMPPDTKFIYTSVPEGFFVYLKVAFVAGVFIASPYIFYQVWAFVAPGLYREERRHVLPLAVFSALFFVLGALFCYFVVFPFAFKFFMSYSTGIISAMPSLNEYLGFALKMLIAFGLVFEMPLFTYFLARLGLVTTARMRAARRYAVLAVFVAAAILTPPDVFSQMLMAGPMLLLYEISIIIAAIFGRKKTPPDEKPQDSENTDSQDGNTSPA